MSKLRDFIASQREEIRQQMALLQKELDELDAAEHALSQGKATASLFESAIRPSASAHKSLSIKAQVLAVLKDRPSGADANRILALIKQRFGVDVPRTSLSPQLSRLKTDNEIVLSGKTWSIAPPKNKESPETSGLSQ